MHHRIPSSSSWAPGWRLESGKGAAGKLQSDGSSGLEKHTPTCHQHASEGPGRSERVVVQDIQRAVVILYRGVQKMPFSSAKCQQKVQQWWHLSTNPLAQENVGVRQKKHFTVLSPGGKRELIHIPMGYRSLGAGWGSYRSGYFRERKAKTKLQGNERYKL